MTIKLNRKIMLFNMTINLHLNIINKQFFCFFHLHRLDTVCEATIIYKFLKSTFTSVDQFITSPVV